MSSDDRKPGQAPDETKVKPPAGRRPVLPQPSQGHPPTSGPVGSVQFARVPSWPHSAAPAARGQSKSRNVCPVSAAQPKPHQIKDHKGLNSSVADPGKVGHSSLSVGGVASSHPPEPRCTKTSTPVEDVVGKRKVVIKHDTSVERNREMACNKSHPAQDKTKDKRLKKRLNDLKRKSKLPEQQSNTEILNDIMNGIEKEDAETGLKWERRLSGSSFDKTKIGHPNEYDVTFVLKATFKFVREAPIYHPQTHIEEKSFCFFKKSSGHLVDAFVTRDIGGAKYISPKLFRSYFRSRVQLCIRNIKPSNVTISEEESCSSSPAVTLKVCSNKDRGLMFMIDFVPALKIFAHPPQPALAWQPRWIDQSTMEKIKKRDTLGIPKIHSSEISTEPESCRLFRITFSEHEKNVLLHADGSLNNADDKKTCRKDVLKLVKNELEQAKCNLRPCKGKPEGEIIISSYIIKTVLLHLFDEKPEAELWVIERMRERYLDALGLLIKCLREMEVRHYFISSDNLLSAEMSSGCGISQAEAARLERYFEGVAREWGD